MRKFILSFPKILVFIIIAFFSPIFSEISAQISFTNAGVGGGGALFSPSINPNNKNNFSLACDMSQVFVTNDWGKSYDQIHYNQIQASHHSKICFTKDPNIVYCVSNANDLTFPMLSRDAGKTFKQCAGYASIQEALHGIWVDYDYPERLIVSQYGAVFLSNDSGKTFETIHVASDPGTGVVVGGVFFDQENIIIGTNDGILVSTNWGDTFTDETPSGLPSTEHIWSFTAMSNSKDYTYYFLTANQGTYWAGMFDDDPSAYVTWNSGTNSFEALCKSAYSYNPTTKVLKKLTTAFNSDIQYPMWIKGAELSYDEANSGVVYIAGSSSSYAPIVRKSVDFGKTWQDVFITTNNQNIYTGWSGQGGDRAWSYGEVALGFTVCPNDNNRLIMTDFGFAHTSSDGGATWHQAYTAKSNNLNTVITPKQSQSSIGLENTTSWQIVWSDANNMFACFSDIKGIRSTDAGKSWSFDYLGHNANSMYRIAQSDNGTMIAASSNIHDMYQSTRLADNILDANDGEGKLIYSTDKGASWSLLKLFSHPVFWVEIDPNNQKTAYASVIHYNNGSGIGGVYKTTDLDKLSAATWTKLANPPRTEGHPACLKVLKNGNLLATYSGRRDSKGKFTASSGLFLYDNSKSTWTDLSHDGMKYWCKDVIIDPTDASQATWYVCVFGGWGGGANNLGGIYRTTNSGANWTRIWNNDRVSSITFDPKLNNGKSKAYITTEQSGLWTCENIKDASPVFTNIPEYKFRQPERVFFNPYNTNQMWVTSFGNGLKSYTAQKDPTNYTISASANTNGKISPSGDIIVNQGDSRTFIITANQDFVIDSLEVDAVKIAPVDTYTFSNITTNHTIVANFKAKTTNTYTISSKANAHGTINPQGNLVVAEGESKTYTITPDNTYKIDSIEIDGNKIAPQSEYTFSNIKANHSIVANFSSISSIELSKDKTIETLFRIENDKLILTNELLNQENNDLIYSYDLVNMEGKKFPIKLIENSFDISNLASGVFYFSIQIGAKLYNQSFVIAR